MKPFTVYKGRKPKYRYLENKNCGHTIQYDLPELTAKEAIDFLTGCSDE